MVGFLRDLPHLGPRLFLLPDEPYVQPEALAGIAGDALVPGGDGGGDSSQAGSSGSAFQAHFVEDLASSFAGEFGRGISPTGRARLPLRLMVSLRYPKNSFNLSDFEIVDRWAGNVQWQFFCGIDFYEPRLPRDATQGGCIRHLLGEEGFEQLPKAAIDSAVDIRAVKPAELERVFVDSTVRFNAILPPVDSRQLEIARHKVVAAA